MKQSWGRTSSLGWPALLLTVVLFAGVAVVRTRAAGDDVDADPAAWIEGQLEPWRDALAAVTETLSMSRDAVDYELDYQERLTGAVDGGDVVALREVLSSRRPAWREELQDLVGVRHAASRLDPRRATQVGQTDDGVFLLGRSVARYRATRLRTLRDGALRGQLEHLLHSDGPLRQLSQVVESMRTGGQGDRVRDVDGAVRLEVEFEPRLVNLLATLREVSTALRREAADVPDDLREALRRDEEQLDEVLETVRNLGGRSLQAVAAVLGGRRAGSLPKSVPPAVVEAFPQLDFSTVDVLRTPYFLSGDLYQISERRLLLVDGSVLHKLRGSPREVRTVARWLRLVRDRVDPAAVALECSTKAGPLADRIFKVNESASRFHRLCRRPWALLAGYLQAAYGENPAELDRHLQTLKEMTSWDHDRVMAVLVVDSNALGRQLMEYQDLLLQNLLVEVQPTARDDQSLTFWARANDGGRVSLRRFGDTHSGLVPVVPGSTEFLFVGGDIRADGVADGDEATTPLRQRTEEVARPPAYLRFEIDPVLQPRFGHGFQADGIAAQSGESSVVAPALDIDRLLQINRQGEEG